jgi:hypothetical protein
MFLEQIEPIAPSPADLKAWLSELDLTASKLASRFQQLGDFRSHNTILRGLQRALSGETAVSAELSMIMKMLLYQRRRYQRASDRIEWTSERGGIHAEVRNYRISLYENRNGNWQIHVVDKKSGYSQPFPSYPNNLESAKLLALECADAADEVLETHS